MIDSVGVKLVVLIIMFSKPIWVYGYVDVCCGVWMSRYVGRVLTLVGKDELLMLHTVMG